MRDRGPVAEGGDGESELDDILSLVLAWMRALGAADRAEDLAVDAAVRYLLGRGPDWLKACNDRTRLSYSTTRVVLESRGVLERE